MTTDNFYYSDNYYSHSNDDYSTTYYSSPPSSNYDIPFGLIILLVAGSIQMIKQFSAAIDRQRYTGEPIPEPYKDEQLTDEERTRIREERLAAVEGRQTKKMTMMTKKKNVKTKPSRSALRGPNSRDTTKTPIPEPCKVVQLTDEERTRIREERLAAVEGRRTKKNMKKRKKQSTSVLRGPNSRDTMRWTMTSYA